MAKGRKRPASELDKASSAQPAAGSTVAGGDCSAPDNVTPSTNKSEIRFGRHLASSDKRVRDQTVSALREWLFHRSRGGVLTELDLLKIWRGLWYCMFMCDKAPIQRELAQNLASLIHLFKDNRTEGVRFFRCFCVTMQRDWERIDHLRIDKYYTLVRLFVREAIGFCRVRRASQAAAAHVQAGASSPGKPAKKKKKRKSGSNGSVASLPPETDLTSTEKNARDGGDGGDGWEWDMRLLEAVVAAVEDEILNVHPAPIGLRLHVADIWVEEAFEAGGEDVSTEVLLVLLAPWLRAAAAPDTNAVVFKRSYEGVFQGLLEFFPQESEGERVFKKADLSKIQACIFEVAAAPQTRDKRRVDLYKLHREYQKLTGVSPDVNAPPSGILPLPLVDTDSEDGGEFVEAGGRVRAVRGLEPPVAGWVAAGIASGDIASDCNSSRASKGGKDVGKKGKRGGGENQVDSKSKEGAIKDNMGDDGEEPKRVKAKKRKKKREGIDRAEGRDDGEKGHGNKVEGNVDVSSTVDSKDQKDTPEVTPAAGSPAGGATSDDSPAKLLANNTPVSSGKKKNKKRKSKELVAPCAETPEKAKDVGGKSDEAVSGVVGGESETQGINGASPVPGLSPLPSPARKKRKKKRESSEGNGKGDAGGDLGILAEVVSEPTRSAAEEGSSSVNDVELSEAGVYKPTKDSSTKKNKLKAKEKSPSPGDKPKMSPVPDNPSARSPPSLRTPPRASGNGSPLVKTPGKGGSVKKTVTFGVNTAKDHKASVKDLKTRVITPSKDSGTPHKGLLKVAGGSAVKPTRSAVGRKGTPSHRSKRASDFF